MLTLLWLIPVLPFTGFMALVAFGARLSRRGVAQIGVGSVGLAALVTVWIAFRFVGSPPPNHAYSQTLWTWMSVANFTPTIAFYLDALALVMSLVVTVVGFLIHLYAAEFMCDEEGYSRFFAYMNLFVASMLTLLLADNVLLLYLGWEGVGLCSYLLIGFWYQDPANGRAARKAFIVTRIGDTAMAIGIFLLFTILGDLNIQSLMQRAEQAWPVGAGVATAAAALLLAGALGKSAQLPLQTWLPDAMAGPTPVSALIHAATMVTAGVYLIARTHVLFSLAPAVQAAVAVIGALTLLMAGCSALVQRDIKRVLAYSTISQIGYMFLALGVGAWSAAIFHFMTHAFFKALLFLAAGVVIQSLHHEHDIFRMGGLWRRLPVAFLTFLIASASLAGLPLVTAGFYSKDLILWQVWASEQGSVWLWAAGLVGTLLTALYIFRVVFRVFLGPVVTPVSGKPGFRMRFAMLLLALLSIVGGWVEIPETIGALWPGLPESWRHLTLFTDVMHTALPASHLAETSVARELTLQISAGAVSLLGILLALGLFLWNRRRPQVAAHAVPPHQWRGLYRLWAEDWGFDALYDTVLVQPFIRLAQWSRDDVADALATGTVWLSQRSHDCLSRTQTGRLRWYAAILAAGSVFIAAWVVFL
jgi:NADH-quinone oxidoreductase subunit L